VVDGWALTPETRDLAMQEVGIATWYGRKFHGQRTASGEVYSMYAMTAAHRTMPIPSYARVRNPANGREVIVRINDRGPFVRGRLIDLSWAAAVRLDVHRGASRVEVVRITHEQIRSADLGAGGLAAAPPMPVPPPSAKAAVPLDEVTPEVGRAFTRGSVGFWLQLGAFSKLDGAHSWQHTLAGEWQWLSPLLTVFTERGVHRVQAGPYGSRDEARQILDRLRTAGGPAGVLVERR
jgi:rare lipoprotein A